MPGSSDDFRSRVQEYKQGLEDLLVEAQGAIDRQAPDLLDKVAATARNLAQHLDDLASEARQRAEQREATPEAATPGSEGESDGGAAPPEEAVAEEAATEGEEPPPKPPDEPPRSSGESSTAA